jgi:hypothetical protein
MPVKWYEPAQPTVVTGTTVVLQNAGTVPVTSGESGFRGGYGFSTVAGPGRTGSRNRQTILNTHKNGVPGSGRCRIFAGMMAHRAGRSRHNRPSRRLEIPLEADHLEFVCVQVRVRLGHLAILHA